MQRILVLSVIVGLLVGCGTTELRSQDNMGPQQHIAYTPGQMQWEDGPASLPPGCEWVVLEGDPSEPGMFAMRLRFPDGYRIPPHWHPNYERINVISGTFHLGMGGMFDEDALERFEAGSYTVMPSRMRHFVVAEGETVIQITTVGPWEINYVNPADDPRR
ncbi:MAG: cupin domain-containing protein [Hyphomicrobiales bacterium]